ncbi:MAG TPA: DUF3857 domain-containing protein [archaeon]|nr:DUF3857 domain-containing protein [archaeon]
MKRMGRYFLGATVVWLVYCLAVGRPAPAKDEWLPITPEDLALKDNPASPGSDAMFLYRESDINAEQAAFHEYVRIKIFTQEGTKRADIQIPFLKDRDRIEDLRARTIHPDGSIVNFEGQTFEKEVVKASGYKFLATTFTLPDVQPGSIIEYKFRNQYNTNYGFLSFVWYISGDLFTREGHFSIKPNPRAFYGFSFRQYGLGSGQLPEEQKDGSYALVVHDIKGIEDEPYMPPLDALRIRVKFFYKTAVEPRGETTEQFWNRMAKYWNDEMEKFLDKKKVLESDLARTVNPGDPPEVKLRKIYARVQQIRNTSYEARKSKKEVKEEALKANNNVEDMLKHGYSGGVGIDWLMVGLARAAGFEATEMRVTSRAESFFLPNIKDASQLNNTVVWVRAGGQEYFLDPGSATYPFGLLPWGQAGANGIRVSKDGGSVVQTAATTSSQATVLRQGDLTLDDEGTLSGTIRAEYQGQPAALRREDHYADDDTGRKKSMEKEIQNSLPSGAVFELTKLADWDDVNKPLVAEGTVKMTNFGSAVGRRMLVPATIFTEPVAKSFETSHRVNMVYFHFPYEHTDELKFHAPAGFTVETLPAPQSVNPGVVKYAMSITKEADGVTVKRQLLVNAVLIPVTSYGALRQFFNTVKSDDEAQLVFQNSQNASNN